MKLTEICIHRPVLATVLSLALLVVGIVTFNKLQVRHYPNFDKPVITITTGFSGASADIVESQITKPLENALGGLEGIDFMTSTSSQAQSRIVLTFKLERNIDSAANDVRDRVGKATASKDYPKRLNPPDIIKASADNTPTVTLIVYPESGGLMEASNYSKKVLESELKAVPGVATVNVAGGGEPTMYIRVDPVKMKEYRVTAEDINRALVAQNVEKPAGQLKSKYYEIAVATKASLNTAEDFKNVVIRENKGYLVKISDIALDVVFESVDDLGSARFNGKPCIILNVIKQSVANPITVSDGIRKILPKIQENMPAGLSIKIALDRSVFIKKSIDQVYQTIAEAIILVILVIFFFLRSMRASLIPIVTIPLSLVGTFALIYVMGFSINVLTLLAMVMAIGLVVDDAIVVLENIYKHIEDGMSPMAATIKGSKEIGVAVIAMTITLAAVYAPIALSAGMTGKIFSEFALSLAGAVILSGFIALTLSPMMCGKMLKHHEQRKKPTRKDIISFAAISLLTVFAAVYLENIYGVEHLVILTIFALGVVAAIIVYDKKIDTFLQSLDLAYEHSLRTALMKPLFRIGKGSDSKPVLSRFLTMLIGLIVAAIGGIIAIEMKQDMAPSEDQGIVMVTGQIPEGVNLAYVDKYMKQAEKTLMKTKELESQLSYTDLAGRRAQIENFLVPWEDRKRSSAQIADSVKPDLADITGMIISANGQIPSALGGSGSESPVEIIIQSSGEFAELKELFEEFTKQFSQVEGVFGAGEGAKETLLPDVQELIVDIDRTKAAQLGVDVSLAGDMVEILLSRNPAVYMNRDGYRYPVVIELGEKFRRNPEDLSTLYYRASTDRKNEYMVPLGEFVKFKYETMPGNIAHYNGMRAFTFFTNIKPGYGLGEILDEAKVVATKVLPRGGTTRFDLGGQSKSFKEESSNIMLIFILAVISIYLVLSAQYESFLDPIIIMVSVPLSLVGGIVTLMLFGGDGFQTQSTFPWVYDFQFGTMSIFGKIGLVTLIGLITKHGILIVDFSNKLVDKGYNRFEAVITASRQRLRPILMTTFAMVLGAIPLAIATGAGYESRRQIGWVIVGGMSFGTLFTLFIVPVFYTYICTENLNKLIKKVAR